MQTKTWVRKRLADARRVGELHLLYWTIEVIYPLGQVGGRTVQERMSNRRRALTLWGKVPAFPVGDDPEFSRKMVNLFIDTVASEWFGGGVTLETVLTPEVALAGYPWYNVDTVDNICPVCGTVTVGSFCDCEEI